ncbi:MAG: hypothetical protein ACRC5Q_02190 [Culicoidibacterales bacterium]
MILLWSTWLLAITYLLYGKNGELAKINHWFTTAIILTGGLLLINLVVANLEQQLLIVGATILVAIAAVIKVNYFNISRWCVLIAAIIGYFLLF